MASVNIAVEPAKGHKRRNDAILISVFLLFMATMSALIISQYLDYQQPRYGPGPVNIEVTTEKPFYLPGEQVRFNIYVNNQQDWPVREPDHVKYKLRMDGNGDYVVEGGLYITYAADSIPVFPAHSRTFFNPAFFNLTGYYDINSTFHPVTPGNYTFTVSFEGPVEYGDIGNYTIEVGPNPNLDNSPSPALLFLDRQ